MNRLVIIILIFLASSVNGQDWAGCTDCSGSSAPGTYPPDVLEIKSSNEGWLAKGSDGASGKKNHNSISRTYAAKSCYGKGWACYSHLMCIKFYNSKDRWDIRDGLQNLRMQP